MNVNISIHFVPWRARHVAVAMIAAGARADSDQAMLRVLAINHKHIRIFPSNAKQYVEQKPKHRVDFLRRFGYFV
jgi:hypothetical protein